MNVPLDCHESATDLPLITKQDKAMTTEFKELRKNLPWNYLSLIAAEVPEITRRQVRGVFVGEITNHQTIEKVIDGAMKVMLTTKMRDKRLLQKLQATRRYRKSTKMAA